VKSKETTSSLGGGGVLALLRGWGSLVLSDISNLFNVCIVAGRPNVRASRAALLTEGKKEGEGAGGATGRRLEILCSRERGTKKPGLANCEVKAGLASWAYPSWADPEAVGCSSWIALAAFFFPPLRDFFLGFSPCCSENCGSPELGLTAEILAACWGAFFEDLCSQVNQINLSRSSIRTVSRSSDAPIF
jgi:hypothetical protein